MANAAKERNSALSADEAVVIQAMRQLKSKGAWPQYVTGYEVEQRPNLLGEPAVWITLKSTTPKSGANENVIALAMFVQAIQTAMASKNLDVAPVIRIIDSKRGVTPIWARGPGWVHVEK
jgi:hypothetical protein